MDPARSPDDAELFDFVDEYHRDLDSGRDRTLGHYLRRFPGHEESIAREYMRLRGELSTPLAPEPAPQPKDERRIGPYQLLRELGQGGQGAVWLAEDTRIARQVALKFMPSSFALLSSERRRRFQREAEVVSRLDHASICPVYEAQIDHDPPYIAMRWVEGETLASAIARARVGQRASSDVLPLPPRNALELRRVLQFFERAARALHAAHEAGVVHRDFKPGNVMVTKSGEPVVLDFGQARDERADQSERTISGEVLGTPAYMSPEQIEGSAHALDRRTDVWSLGASLYEASTLVRPFYADSVAALMHAIRTQPLPAPRTHNKALDEDTAVVLETALEKELTRRYATALELAEDLRRIREYEPIRARPASAALKLRRWAQRHPALAMALLAITGGLSWSFHLLRRENTALERERKAIGERGAALEDKTAALERERDALAAKDEAAQREILALKREAEAIDSALGRYLAVRAGDVLPEDPAASLALALKAVALAPGYQSRSAVFSALNECWLASVYQSENGKRIHDIDVSADGEHIVGGLVDGRVRLWELHGGAELFALEVAPEIEIERVRFAPSGAYFVAGTERGELAAFDARAGTALGREALFDAAIVALEPIPGDERWIALARNGSGCVLRGSALELQARFELAQNSFNDVHVAHDGRWVLVASAQPPRPDPLRSERALVLDPTDGHVLAELAGDGAVLSASALSPDGALAATAALDGSVRVWALPEGRQLGAPLAHDAPVSSVCFSRDGARLYTGTDAEERSRIRVWELATRSAHELAGPHTSRIESIDVCARDGDVVVSSRDTAVSVWNEDDTLQSSFRERLRPVNVRWTSDGSRLVTFALATYSHVWWGENRPDVYELRGSTAAIRAVAFDARGTRAFSLDSDGTARLWSTPRTESERGEHATGLELARAAGVDDQVAHGRFDPSGRLLLATRAGRVGWLDDGATELADVAWVDSAVVDLDEQRSASDARQLVVTQSGAVFVRQLGPPGAAFTRVAEGATCARFLDAERIVLGGREDRVRVVSSSGALLGEYSWESSSVEHGVQIVAIRPDGREFVVACRDTKLRFFDPSAASATRAPLAMFPTIDLAYDVSSKLLLAVGPRGHSAVRVVSLASGKAVREQAFHTADLTDGSFDAQGTFVLTSSKDRSVYIRRADDGEPFARRSDFASAVTCSAFSADDGALRVISGCEDGRVYVWPVDPVPAARARQPRQLWDWEDVREKSLAAPLPYR
ncbi:MAG: protein kinase [Planctomycetes bacterium]|nr:protein kinase [Planctomycetota bacterium]